MVGNCGATDRMDYTAIGDCVNLASRLESANKDFHTRILVADVTWRAAGISDLPVRPLGPVLIRGVDQPVDIWEVWAGPTDQDLEAAMATFAQGVSDFHQGRFGQAQEAFKKVAEAIPGDFLSQLYLSLCDYGQSWSPSQAWQPSCGDGDVGRIAPPAASTSS
jgi:adenylate cyclase